MSSYVLCPTTTTCMMSNTCFASDDMVVKEKEEERKKEKRSKPVSDVGGERKKCSPLFVRAENFTQKYCATDSFPFLFRERESQQGPISTPLSLSIRRRKSYFLPGRLIQFGETRVSPLSLAAEVFVQQSSFLSCKDEG